MEWLRRMLSRGDLSGWFRWMVSRAAFANTPPPYEASGAVALRIQKARPLVQRWNWANINLSEHRVATLGNPCIPPVTQGSRQHITHHRQPPHPSDVAGDFQHRGRLHPRATGMEKDDRVYVRQLGNSAQRVTPDGALQGGKAHRSPWVVSHDPPHGAITESADAVVEQNETVLGEQCGEC